MRKQYNSNGAEIGVSDIVEILSSCEEIELDLPKDGIETESGWNLLPLTYPQVCKIAAVEFCMLASYFLTMASFCEDTLMATGLARKFLRLNF